MALPTQGAQRPQMAKRALGGAADTLRPRGSSQGGLRQYNERVVLQALRLHGALPAAELARLTHLTAQTISLISKRLLDDGLIVRGELLRGRVGQPSVPLALNPDGAYAIGIKVGRRSLDVLLVDFCGHTRQRLSLDYPYPDPDTLFDAIDERIKALVRTLGRQAAQRIEGIGIAAPLSLGGWQALLGIAPEQAAKWLGIDIAQRVAARAKLPVQMVKDTAAACVAELVAGRGREIRSFLYIFVDTFIGGGLVIGSHLHAGLHGNAGAVGSMSTARASERMNGHGTPPQLLGVASLLNLEALYRERKLDAAAATDRARAAATVARGNQRLARPGGAGDCAGGAQRRLPARPGRRHRRRLVQPRAAGRTAARAGRRDGWARLGRRGAARAAGRYHRLGRARHRRRAAAAVCRLRARQRPVP